jgi:hypothetical protein
VAAPKPGRLFREVLLGYLRVLRRVGLLLLLVVAAGAAGLLVTWPLWLFATRHRQGYTLFIAALLGLLLLLLLAFRLRRSIRECGGFAPLVRLRWLPAAGRMLIGLLLLGLLYLVLVLLAGGRVLPGVLLAAVFLLILGLVVRTVGSRR